MYLDSVKKITLEESDTLELLFTLNSAFSIDQEISIGSRSGAKSLLDASLPVDIISPEQISQS